MMLTEDKAKKIKEFVENLLYDRFGDQFVFDPILVETRTDYIHGEEYVNVLIVLDGDGSGLDADWTSRMALFMMPKMEELGLPPIANHEFALKSEWEEGPPD